MYVHMHVCVCGLKCLCMFLRMRGCETMCTHVWIYGCVQARSFKWTMRVYASKITVWRGWSRWRRASKCFQIEQLQLVSSYPLWQDQYQLQQQEFQMGLRVCDCLTRTFVFSPSMLFSLTLLCACTGSGCCEGWCKGRGKSCYGYEQGYVYWLLSSSTYCHGKIHTQPGYNDQKCVRVHARVQSVNESVEWTKKNLLLSFYLCFPHLFPFSVCLSFYTHAFSLLIFFFFSESLILPLCLCLS